VAAAERRGLLHLGLEHRLAPAAGALDHDLGEIARRTFLEPQARARAPVVRSVREVDPVELLDVALAAGQDEPHGHALARPLALAPVQVPPAFLLQGVAPDQRPAVRVLAHEPLRELQHLHAARARGLRVVAHRRFQEVLVRVQAEPAPDQRVAQPRVQDHARAAHGPAPVEAPEVEPAHEHGVVDQVHHGSRPEGRDHLALPHLALGPDERLLAAPARLRSPGHQRLPPS
jgi:hypothetical protein